MTKIKGKNVLITGGASGIGKIMGRICLEKGAKNLIVWDVNPTSLEATRLQFSTLGNVTTYQVDITNDEAVVETYRQVLNKFERIGVLINCAGIVRGNKTFNHNTIDDVRLTFNVKVSRRWCFRSKPCNLCSTKTRDISATSLRRRV